MHRELVLNAFDKAKREVIEATGVTMSITGLSKKISDYLMNEFHFQYHEKSLRNKYKIALKEENVELKSAVANYLCRYLGYENYAAFILGKNMKNREIKSEEVISPKTELINPAYSKREPSMGEKLKIVIQKNKVTLIFCSLLFLFYFGLIAVNKHKSMFDGSHYVCSNVESEISPNHTLI